MGKKYSPVIKENRFGEKVYVCPRCGRVFYSLKQYSKHISKSHLQSKK